MLKQTRVLHVSNQVAGHAGKAGNAVKKAPKIKFWSFFIG